MVRGEGTHFMVPWVQKPIIYDVRSQPRNIPVVTPSKDLQNVNITLRILYRPEISNLPWIHKVRCLPCALCLAFINKIKSLV